MYILSDFRVFSAIVFGAMSVGQASAFVPDYGKAKSAAGRIFFLLDIVPEIDTFSDEGEKPVRIKLILLFITKKQLNLKRSKIYLLEMFLRDPYVFKSLK